MTDMARRTPNPPGIFVLDDGMGLVAKRLEHIPNSDPPAVRVISDNPVYSPYERTADEIHTVGRIRWFAREI
ncbi:S24 family peptidase [Ruegeria intermedia]|nr:S24 family peptidase [Ruegeria intermedia]